MLRLREARVARGLSQDALAARAGVSASTISRLERGKTRARPHVARRLAVALGLDRRPVGELRPGVRESGGARRQAVAGPAGTGAPVSPASPGLW